LNVVEWITPLDWAAVSVNSQSNFYVRARATATSVYNTTAPTLTQAWIRTGGPNERPLVLSYLREAAARVCFEVDLRIPADTTVTLTGGTAAYLLNTSPFPTDMVRLLSVKLTDAAITGVPIDQIPMHEMDLLRIGTQATGSPMNYAVEWPNFMLFPTPNTSTTISISYVQDAPTLIDSSDKITFIPDAFQWGCLYNFAMSGILEYKHQPEAETYLNKFFQDRNAGLPALRRWRASSGGSQMMRGSGIRPTVNPSQDTGIWNSPG